MKSIVRGGLLAGATLLLTACGSVDGKRNAGPAAGPAPSPTSVVDGPAKLGSPYAVGGITYTPVDVADYDDVGYASWYGEELAGNTTANGESFDPGGITAAHKTLPLPSYVEVTALDTGRTILVRVNDRGPMVTDRLIDLSRGAAEQLGIADGVAGVRVRRTNPPASEKAQLRAGRSVTERAVTPDNLLAILRRKLGALPAPRTAAAVVAQPAAPVASGKVKPGADRLIVLEPSAKPVVKPAAVAGTYAVQVAAFSSESRAAAAAKSVGGVVTKAGNLWRVRIGPLASEAEAQAALGKAKAKGFRDAVVLRDR